MVLILTALFVPDSNANAENCWWPIQVKSYYGIYETKTKKSGKASSTLQGPKLEEWLPPTAAARPYTIGISVPHIKDSYWVAVNYGIIQEAKRLGVGIKMREAGGYNNLDKQIKQVEELIRSNVDGIILGSISYTGTDAIITKTVKSNIPIVEVINDINAPDITAKALVSFYDMGYYAGEFLAEHAEDSGKNDLRILFLPGPQASGWASDTLDGFNDAMQYFPGRVDIVAVKWGDTGRNKQSELIRNAMKDNPDIDYIVGNAVAAEVAPEILKESGKDKKTAVVSTYIIPALYDKIKTGKVIAAPSDLTVFQGRMAVDMLVRILNGKKAGTDFPFRSGPFIPTITPENIKSYPYEGLFGPRDYKPVFKLEPKK
ncbi:TMAO reductase system periplasmic protein TorT [Maridesulfovibrio hydrothermalis]|nr:TMAO reductase system periplasmic protein TorT [Maridesulfovibrio hydrothermalis]